MNTKILRALVLVAVGLVMGVIVLATAGKASTLLGLWLTETALKLALGSCIAAVMLPIVHRFQQLRRPSRVECPEYTVT